MAARPLGMKDRRLGMVVRHPDTKDRRLGMVSRSRDMKGRRLAMVVLLQEPARRQRMSRSRRSTRVRRRNTVGRPEGRPRSTLPRRRNTRVRRRPTVLLHRSMEAVMRDMSSTTRMVG